MTEHLARDVRRDQILDAAAKMFIAQGYENSTVDEIAKEAGLSKGSIYWYFKSKLDILFALTDRCVDSSQEELVKLADMDRYGPQAMYKAHRELNQNKLQQEEHKQLLGQLANLAPRYPEIRDRLLVYYQRWDGIAESLIRRAVDAGYFRDIDAHRLAQAITAMYDGLYLRRDIDPTVDVVSVLETCTRLLYEALIVHKPAERVVEELS
jgi:AcrR family transcriptional regulator